MTELGDIARHSVGGGGHKSTLKKRKKKKKIIQKLKFNAFWGVSFCSCG